MQYFALIIPFIIISIAYVFHGKKVHWIEFFLPIIATLLSIVLSVAIIKKQKVIFTEYWGDVIQYIIEEEPYNYWHQETCSRSYQCGTDSNGNAEYCTEYYDCSHQVDVQPKWYCISKLGYKYLISEKQFDELKLQFQTNPNIIKTRKNHSPNDKAINSKGTKFQNKKVGKVSNVIQYNWDGDYYKSKPIFSEHKYINKIKASDLSLFNISIVSEEQADSLNLFDYPKLNNYFYYPTILGIDIDNKIHENYNRLNANFGISNQLRLWVLIYENNDMHVAFMQENYWVKGNKNELVICIGIDKSKNILWTHSFSWGTSEALTINVKQRALELNVINDSTLNIYHDYLYENLHHFKRREFKEFDYINVKLTNTNIMVIYLISLIISISITIYVTNNKFN